MQYRKAETDKISNDETKLFSEILVWRKTRKQAIPERHHHYVGGGADGESTFDEDKDDNMEPEGQ